MKWKQKKFVIWLLFVFLLIGLSGLVDFGQLSNLIVKAGSKGIQMLSATILRKESNLYEYTNWQEALKELESSKEQVSVEDELAALVIAENQKQGEEGELSIQYAKEGNITPIAELEEKEITETIAKSTTSYTENQLLDYQFLLNNFYIIDSSTVATKAVFQPEVLLKKDLAIEEKNSENPQILIYHTHASETYSNSRADVEEDTVVGPGNLLTQLLEEKGYSVLHNKTAYDKKDGKDNRNYAYITARPEIEKILEDHPSIEIVIDLHRDAGKKRITTVEGKETAKIMFFNGLCRDVNGPMESLYNPYIQDNLAFSLQMKLLGDELYPDLFYRIYLKNYRYNMHMRPKSLLIELGTNENTIEEAYRAMEPLAKVLDVLLKDA